jgi:RNA polymerase sigma factor (sigma-70 family)
VDDAELTAFVLRELRTGGPRGLSEDQRLEIAQTTLLKLYQHYPHVAWPEKRALCRRIARFTALDHLRRAAVQKRFRGAHQGAVDSPSKDDVAAALAKAEIRTLVLDAVVHSLTPDEQRIIDARFFQGMTLVRIASEMDIPISTLHGRLMKALGKLGATLGRYRDLLE